MVMLAVEMARDRGIPHVYLGYRVMGCASMRYKSLFRPHELLRGLPGPDEQPHWVEAPGGQGGAGTERANEGVGGEGGGSLAPRRRSPPAR